MGTTFVRRFGVMAVAGGLLIGFAGPAFASGATGTSSTPTTSTVVPGTAGTTLNTLKQRCETAVNNRLASITTATAVVKDNQYLTGSDRSKLQGQIAAEQTGLSALGEKIAGDSDLATLRADCKSIVAQFHWYIIQEPKIHLTIAADTAAHAVARLQDLSSRLQADIDRAKAKGKDVTQAQADEGALNAAITAGLNAAAPVPAMVLPLADNNWAAAQPVLTQARTDMGQARSDFVTARTGAQKVRADLKAL
ncbi:MAG TPA: hypothetical protein VFW71_02225 [Actinomycetota bacterium]|nr:hypothetical protein [Actinomycetota bacterium]